LNGGFVNGENQADAIHSWNGLELFNNADNAGTTNTSDPEYSGLLSSIDALGGKVDAKARCKRHSHFSRSNRSSSF
jgi:hypothetical protein